MLLLDVVPLCPQLIHHLVFLYVLQRRARVPIHIAAQLIVLVYLQNVMLPLVRELLGVVEEVHQGLLRQAHLLLRVVEVDDRVGAFGAVHLFCHHRVLAGRVELLDFDLVRVVREGPRDRVVEHEPSVHVLGAGARAAADRVDRLLERLGLLALVHTFKRLLIKSVLHPRGVTDLVSQRRHLAVVLHPLHLVLNLLESGLRGI